MCLLTLERDLIICASSVDKWLQWRQLATPGKLLWLQEVQVVHPKSEECWHTRMWYLLQFHADCPDVWASELRFINVVCSSYPHAYHPWAHFCWMMEQFPPSEEFLRGTILPFLRREAVLSPNHAGPVAIISQLSKWGMSGEETRNLLSEVISRKKELCDTYCIEVEDAAVLARL